MLPNFKRAKSEADKLLEGIGYDAPPVDPIEIANSLGLSVYAIDMEDDLKQVAGFLDLETDEILLNNRDSIEKKLYTTAHELGRHLLFRDHLEKHEDEYILPSRSLNKNGQEQDPIENEIKCFATTLLVPEQMLEKFRDQPKSILASLFRVPIQILNYRLGEYPKQIE